MMIMALLILTLLVAIAAGIFIETDHGPRIAALESKLADIEKKIAGKL